MSIEPASPAPEVRTLIDELLSEQRNLSAVERFSQVHGLLDPGPAGQRHRDKIPLSAPRPGEQYGFEVDLDQCSGCKGCVTACHSLNGLDESESWRAVGLLLGEVQVPDSFRPNAGNRVIPWQQTVTTACHHCVEPACLSGCPVLAYHKDPVTGIVHHLDDQCIGCSYCILKCPYEVPRFSARRGIVRKCDMCQGRLAAGEAPACVQACPNEAIRITTVQTGWIAVELRKRRGTDWLPDAPDPGDTLPTTRYLSKHAQPQLLAADHHRNRPAEAHWPLILMLVLTQAGMGGMLAAWVGGPAGGTGPDAGPARGIGLASLGLFLLGLGASVFHLGQPRKAWRVWLGWRTSWMSREAILLNLTTGLSLLTAALLLTPWRLRLREAMGAEAAGLASLEQALGVAIPFALAGSMALSVFSQSMVYVDTRRAYWSWPHTGPRFFGTWIIGAALASAGMGRWPGMTGVAAAAMLIKLSLEVRLLKHAVTDAPSRNQRQRSAELVVGPLRPIFGLRLFSSALSIGALLFGHAAGWSGPAALLLATVGFLSGEIAERWLYFAGVSPDKMPGLP